MLRLSLQIHKWLALIVGLQVLFWVAGGLVMSAIPIGKVRGEHHVAGFQASTLALDALLTPGEAAARAGLAPSEVTLKSTPRGAYWLLKAPDGATHVIDAVTGHHPVPIQAQEARFLAGVAYEGAGHQPTAASYYPKAPQEAAEDGPVWKVEFNDPERTALYLSPETGEVVARRSQLWRFYDFFWRLHILDFNTGDNFNHPLLIGMAALSLPMAITGLVALVIRLRRDLRGYLARAARRGSSAT